MDSHETRVEAVKQYAATHDLMRRNQARMSLGFTDAQMDNAMSRLLKQGILRRVSSGIYEFVDAIPDEASMDEKIWRAMKVSTTFCSADIERLTGAAYGTVQTRIKRYLVDGFIKKAGKERKHGNYGANLYRLTLKGQDEATRPDLKTYRPDELITDTVVLNRLICTGWALHDDNALKVAIGLCGNIMKRLSDLQGGE